MHPEERAFRDQIIDNPDDDTIRLVFADWLEEHDQEDWASYIRFSINSGQSTSDMVEACKRLNPNGDWSKLNQMTCPYCEQRPSFNEVYCKVCSGTRDLFKRYRQTSTNEGPTTDLLSRNPKFSRGMVDSIECFLWELTTVDPYRIELQELEFHPSRWVQAVMRDHPIQRMIVLDRSPIKAVGRSAAVPTCWRWFPILVGRNESYSLPEIIVNSLRTVRFQGLAKHAEYDTQEQALDDLHTTVARLVRNWMKSS